MSFEEEIINIAANYPLLALPVAVISPMIGGEAAVLALAFLSGQDLIPLWIVIIGSFIGMLLLDIFWIIVPRLSWVKGLRKRGREVSKDYRAIEMRIESISNRNDIIILFISKVLIGTRILILAYLSVRNISFSRFLITDGIATFLWAVLLGYLGNLAGIGYYNLRVIYDNILIAALYIVGVAVVLYAVLWSIRRWLMRK